MLPSTDNISNNPSTTHTASNSIGMLALIGSGVEEAIVDTETEVSVDVVVTGSTVDDMLTVVASHLSTDERK